MDRVATAVGNFLARQLGLDEDRREVITYGALSLLHNGFSVLLMLLLAVVTGLVPETFIALTIGAITRHASGGAHLNSSFSCAVVSGVVMLFNGFMGRTLNGFLFSLPAYAAGATALLGMSAGMVILFRLAPVPAETRPLSPGHTAKLHRLSLQIGTILSVLVLTGVWLRSWWVGPTLMGFLMQCLTLTSPGHRVAHAIDKALG